METVFNPKLIDPRSQPIFLGESLGLQRFDQLKYPKFFKLAEMQEGFFWRANEVDLTKDRSDYKRLTETERFIFDSNLRWQTMTDSMLSRSISSIMQYITNPELEACCMVWAFFESNIHSRSYSHILKSVYPDETEFWNSIITDQEILSRAQDIKKAYDDIFGIDEFGTERDVKKAIFNALVSTNVTEALAFYVSFACSFFFGAFGRMEGNAKIIKFIERDERLHAAITTELLRILRDNPEEGFQDIYDPELILEAYRVGLESEKKWAEYLFSKGNPLGLTLEQFKLFAEFKANERLRLLDLPPIAPKQKDNPLGSWYAEFINSEKVQVAPQETEITSYKIGARDTTVTDQDLDDLDF